MKGGVQRVRKDLCELSRNVCPAFYILFPNERPGGSDVASDVKSSDREVMWPPHRNDNGSGERGDVHIRKNRFTERPRNKNG